MSYEKRGYHMREPIARLGDIIQIKGYGSRKFEVFSVFYSLEVDAVEEFEEIFYDVSEINGEELLMAWQEDIVVLETPHEVDYERLEELSSKMFEDVLETFDITMGFKSTKVDKVEKEDADVPRNRSKADKIDTLLDELNRFRTLIKLLGEDEGDEDTYYRDKVDEIKAELAELTRKEE